ncbi:MAG: prolipoprotein diacylglyceryl transferase [Myxococcales bacterium]|nr:prolipoprotein diacylglyceryl transferase [Myxococcales bacterium]
MLALYIPWIEIGPWNIPLPTGHKLPIHAFGILVATGVLVGAKIADWRAEKAGISPAVTSDAVSWVVILGFLLAHVLDVILYHPQRIAEDPWLLVKFWQGLSSYGGFLGGVLGLWLWCRKRKMSMMLMGEILAYGFLFGWVFGRLGCFTAHDHPGTVTTFFLAVDNYQVGEPPFEPRHDLGLYEALWAIATVGVFTWLDRKPRPTGFYFALLPMMYAPVRFFLDFLRLRPEQAPGRGDIRYLDLTPGQWASIGLFLVSVWLMYLVYTRPEPAVPAWAKLPADSQSKRKPRSRQTT